MPRTETDRREVDGASGYSGPLLTGPFCLIGPFKFADFGLVRALLRSRVSWYVEERS